MLEYSYEEAVGVLETSLANAKEKLVRREGKREGGTGHVVYEFNLRDDILLGNQRRKKCVIPPYLSISFPRPFKTPSIAPFLSLFQSPPENDERGPRAPQESDYHRRSQHGPSLQP